MLLRHSGGTRFGVLEVVGAVSFLLNNGRLNAHTSHGLGLLMVIVVQFDCLCSMADESEASSRRCSFVRVIVFGR
jgi:hypothetical protein